MNSNPSIFLDTSIQIERLIGSGPHKVAIERQLSTPTFGAMTSHYVLMEFQRAVVADYVHVYNQILRHKTWDAIAQGLRSGAVAHRPRALGRCLQILTEVMVQSQLDQDDALSILQLTIHRGLLKRFWHNVTPRADAIHCDLVAIGITTHTDGSYTVADSCRKQEAACSLPDFLAEHATEIRLLLNYLSAHRRCIKEQARVERLLQAVLDPRAALGQTACWPLGDIIIALQVPTNALLWTRDPDFTPLATALGITLYVAPA